MSERYTFRHPRGILPFVTCLVCNHPNRYRLETDLREGVPKARVAKQYLISRPKLYDHIKEKHQAKNPASPSQVQEDPTNRDEPELSDELVRDISNRKDRLAHIERLISDRRFEGTKTIAKLARLWRPWLRDKAEDEVCLLVAEAARRHRLKRGPKDVRKELLIIEILSLKEKCTNSGDYKTAASLLAQYAEQDGLKENSSLDRAVLVQIVQLIRTEVPQFAPRVEEHLAQFEIVVDRAKAVLEGEIPTSPLLPEPIPDAPPTPRSSNSGIDTGASSSEEPSSE